MPAFTRRLPSEPYYLRDSQPPPSPLAERIRAGTKPITRFLDNISGKSDESPTIPVVLLCWIQRMVGDGHQSHVVVIQGLRGRTV